MLYSKKHFAKTSKSYENLKKFSLKVLWISTQLFLYFAVTSRPKETDKKFQKKYDQKSHIIYESNSVKLGCNKLDDVANKVYSLYNSAHWFLYWGLAER